MAQTHYNRSIPERPDKSLFPCLVTEMGTEQSRDSPSPSCICCGSCYSLFVFGQPLGIGKSTRSRDSQRLICFNTNDYSSRKLRPQCGIHYLLPFSLLFKTFPVQAQEQPPCAQTARHTSTRGRAHWQCPSRKYCPDLSVSPWHAKATQLCSETLFFPQRRLCLLRLLPLSPLTIIIIEYLFSIFLCSPWRTRLHPRVSSPIIPVPAHWHPTSRSDVVPRRWLQPTERAPEEGLAPAARRGRLGWLG